MIVALDVHYEARGARTAAVGFLGWGDASPALERVLRSDEPAAAYEPGAFYRRELPLLLAALAELERSHPLDAIVVDGHAWLADGHPGLGARLHEAIGGRCPVVGVAKSAFAGGSAVPVLRGQSRQPLWVSAAGMDATAAASCVRALHGPYRLPTLLRRADQLARGIAMPRPAKGPAADALP